jgi:hypothetical protein
MRTLTVLFLASFAAVASAQELRELDSFSGVVPPDQSPAVKITISAGQEYVIAVIGDVAIEARDPDGAEVAWSEPDSVVYAIAAAEVGTTAVQFHLCPATKTGSYQLVFSARSFRFAVPVSVVIYAVIREVPLPAEG